MVPSVVNKLSNKAKIKELKSFLRFANGIKYNLITKNEYHKEHQRQFEAFEERLRAEIDELEFYEAVDDFLS